MRRSGALTPPAGRGASKDAEAVVPSGLDFLVTREDLRRTRFVPTEEPADSELRSGEVLLEIDRFGFSANNITAGLP